MFDENILKLFNIFEAEGIEIYVVGGMVRNHYLHAPIKDIDIAAHCVPEKILEILQANDVRFALTGLSHGTITAILGQTGYEITSFRKDVKTDGRHAKTEFGGSLIEDAQRRDFTINALYMDREQNLVDPLGVKQDLFDRKLRFVGSAQDRAQEDYLRILRFFRFLAQYDLDYDEEAMNACGKLAARLSLISAERIGGEMRRLLEGSRSAYSLDLAKTAGVVDFALPQFEAKRYAGWDQYYADQCYSQKWPGKNWKAELVMASDYLPRQEWRLSNREMRELKALKLAKETPLDAKEMGERFGEDIGFWGLQFHAFERGEKVKEADLEALQAGAQEVFPVNGNDLLALGFEGVQIGDILEELKRKWRLSGYALDKGELLLSLPEKGVK